MKKIKSLFLGWMVLATLALNSAAAFADTQGALAQQVLANSYNDPKMYVFGRCGDNVARLAIVMQKSGVDLREARVIYLLSENRAVPPVPAIRETMLVPKGARSNAEVWDFHAILVIPDSTGALMVYDLDGIPKAVPIEKYFARLFPEMGNGGNFYATGDRLRNISMREIPLVNYLQDMEAQGGDKTAAKYRDKNLQTPPIISVREYLNSFK